MSINVDQEKCIGCGACVAIAPATFKINDNGKSEVINEKGDSEDVIKQAADSCPVQAISIE